MALFTKRERIAVAVIGTLILAGWGIRFGMNRQHVSDGVRVIRRAVEPPPFFSADDTTMVQGGTITAAINIDTADAAILETLPMIGPSRAAAIIRYREEHGPFRSAEDIMNVPGIGRGIYRNIAPVITVGDSAKVISGGKK